jgi:serine protease Do
LFPEAIFETFGGIVNRLFRTLSIFSLIPAALGAVELPSLSAPAKLIRPAVVNISTEYMVENPFGAYSEDPYFQFFHHQFFGQQPRQVPQGSLGSGFIVDAARGYVLTNNHVVEKATTIKVRLSDETELPAKVVGTDPKTDLAVLKIKGGSNLTQAKLGDSDALEVGDWVLAVGSPFGQEQSVTHGIISFKGRELRDAGPYDQFLQTDAPINPGNSGGPLVNLEGEVVGINAAITTQSGGSEGIGFAIPINLAKKVYPQLVAHGKVTRGWLGVEIQALTAALAKNWAYPYGSHGVVVTKVLPGGPAAQAGLRSGDIVTSFEGKPLENARALQGFVADAAAGRSVSLRVWRAKGWKDLAVRLGEMPANPSDPQAETHGQDGAPAGKLKLGLSVDAVSAEEAQQQGAGNSAGLLVKDVVQGSPAEGAGLQVGDLIVEAANRPLTSTSDLKALAERLQPGQSLVLKVMREGHALFLTLEAGK